MKHLLIGIDGGTRSILEHFDMPFTHQLLKNSEMPEIHEDVWSRGWAEMYTGKHANETKGYYELPALDGTHRFVRTYKWQEARENPDVQFLWDLLDQHEVSSLFMNIPTTNPAPNLKHGVFVAGAGGGLSNLRKIVDGLCSTEESKNRLEELGYMVDLRYDTSGIKELDVLFSELNRMAWTRAKCFVDLCKQNATDFGFLVFRATTIVQYLAMYEIDHLMKGGQDERPIHGLIREHYKVLDKSLSHIFEQLKPDSYILTADHATVPFRKRSNLNAFLMQSGYQPQKKAGFALKKLLVRILPKGTFQWVKKNTPKTLKEKTRSFDISTTKAFAQENIHGIYINDERRFHGPVKEGTELDTLVDEICKCLNEDPVAKANGLSARPYRRFQLNTYFSDHTPDIFVDRPETLFFDGEKGDFIEDNKFFRPILELNGIPRDVNSGQKGCQPLFVMSKNLREMMMENDPKDLTLAYHLTRRLLVPDTDEISK